MSASHARCAFIVFVGHPPLRSCLLFEAMATPLKLTRPFFFFLSPSPPLSPLQSSSSSSSSILLLLFTSSSPPLHLCTPPPPPSSFTSSCTANPLCWLLQALLVVSESMLTIVARKSNSILLKIEAHLPEEYMIDRRFTPATFGFSFHSAALGIDYITVFQSKEKYTPQVEPCLEALKCTDKKHRQSQINPASLGIQSNVVGTRGAYLLGSVPVSRKNGNEVCRAAADMLKRKHKRAIERLLPITIVVTAESIKYAETLVDESLADVLIKDVSFLTVLDVRVCACVCEGACACVRCVRVCVHLCTFVCLSVCLSLLFCSCVCASVRLCLCLWEDGGDEEKKAKYERTNCHHGVNGRV